MPAQLQYTTASSKMADVGLSRGEGQPSRTSESANADKTAQSVAATSSTIVEDSAPAEDNKQTQFVDAEVTQISPAPTSDKAPLNTLPKAGANGRIGSKLRGPSFPPRGSSQAPFHSDASDVTQSSNIPGFKERMMQMGLPESLTQGDTQTPAMSQSQSQAAAPKQALLRNGKASTRPSLSEHRAGQLHEFQQRLRSTALKLAKSENGKQKAADIILCQCGSSKERGDMVGERASPSINTANDVSRFAVSIVRLGSIYPAMASPEATIHAYQKSMHATSACWATERWRH